jgi:hypothetical protein
MNLVSQNNGPTFVPAYTNTADQQTSNKQLAERLGLDKFPSNSFSGDPNRVTFSSAMSNLVSFLERDKAFDNVVFSEVYPDIDTKLPAITWKLKNRVGGVSGINKKAPFYAMDEPLEGGKVLITYVWPMEYQMVWEVFDDDVAGADSLRDNLEFWLLQNKPNIILSGFESMFFSSELEPSVESNDASQKIHKRQMYFTGVIKYINQVVIDRVKSIKVWTVGQDVTLRTSAVTRGSGDFDTFPITGPVVLVAIHNTPNTIECDYEYETDWICVVDKERFDTNFFIRWLTKGIRPSQDSQYYVTYYLPSVDIDTQTQVLLTEADTNPALQNLPLENPQLSIRRAGLRNPITPHVLGQAVDMVNPDKNKTIIFAKEGSGIHIPGLTNEYLKSLIQADVDVVSVLNPSSIPGLHSGDAF